MEHCTRHPGIAKRQDILGRLYCPACRNAGKRGDKCPNGHPYDNAKGRCAECKRVRNARDYAKVADKRNASRRAMRTEKARQRREEESWHDWVVVARVIQALDEPERYAAPPERPLTEAEISAVLRARPHVSDWKLADLISANHKRISRLRELAC